MLETKVAMFPDYRGDNPYQQLLADQLLGKGYSVTFPAGYRRGAHFTRTFKVMGKDAPGIIHLHWLDPFLRGKSRAMRWIYAWKLRLDLQFVLRRGSGRKLAWTVHNLGKHDTKSNFAERSLYRWLAKRADVLFVHDDSLIVSLKETFGVSPHKTRVIPHGHFRDYYGPALNKSEACRQLGISKDSEVILFLGMLRPYKGLEQLLEVWPQVKSDCPNAVLVIAGSGQTAYVETITRLCRNNSSICLDARFIEDSEIPVYYGAADVAVFPFRKITTSGSVILALSYDCPVVAPNVPSISAPLEFQKELLYKPGSSEELGRSLIKGLRLEKETLKAEFQQIREIYSWSRAAIITADAYAQMQSK